MPFIIEIATTDYHTTSQAVKGGADRVELCAGLSLGGITASYATIRQCRENFDIAIYPIIRPRAGDFLYSPDEFTIMLHDIQLCKQLGCDGIVTGCLRPDGRIDQERMARIIEEAYPMAVTFHRAFDRCVDPFAAMEQLISAGCERILTSGQQPTAVEGASVIEKLVQAASNRIIIMAGSGIRPENIRSIAEETGCREFHSSLAAKRNSVMDYRNAAFAENESYLNDDIDPEMIRALRNELVLSEIDHPSDKD